MIIAEIGSQKFMLDGIKDAEQLLWILSRATNVRESYDLPWDNRMYVEPSGDLIKVSVIEGNPLTYEAAQEAIAADQKKKKQTDTVTV